MLNLGFEREFELLVKKANLFAQKIIGRDGTVVTKQYINKKKDTSEMSVVSN